MSRVGDITGVEEKYIILTLALFLHLPHNPFNTLTKSS